MGSISLHFHSYFFRILNRFRYLIAIAVFAASFFSISLPIQSGIASASNASSLVTRPDYENYYLESVNRVRASNNLPALMIDQRLVNSATNKNIDMINNNYWDHYSPSGLSFSDFIWQQNSHAQRAGEDLARCFASRDEVLQAFIKSPSHYANLIGNFNYIGFSEVVNPTTQCSYVAFHYSS